MGPQELRAFNELNYESFSQVIDIEKPAYASPEHFLLIDLKPNTDGTAL